MKNEVGLGVVGFGRRGQSMFSSAVNAIDGVAPVAVCDVDKGNLEKARELFPSSARFSDFDRMLDEATLDALIVETPANHHAAFCAKALERNIHVLSDIPCVYGFDEVAPLWEAARGSEAMFMTGANPNFWGFVDAAVELREKGELGDPYFFEAEYVHDLGKLFSETPWRRELRAIQYCTHSIGPLNRLLDEDLKWVSCIGTGSRVNSDYRDHDVMIAIFKTRSDKVMKIMVSFSNTFRGGCHSYRVFGTKGCFERFSGRGEAIPPATLFHCPDDIRNLAVAEKPAKFADDPRAIGHGGTDFALLDVFFKSVRSGGPSPIDLRQGLRMTLPGLFAAKSAERGGALVEIHYPWEDSFGGHR